MTIHTPVRVSAVALVTTMLLLGVLATGAGAEQESESPQVTLSSANIEIDVGETSTVTAEYQFDVGSVGSGDSRLSTIPGRVWKMPDNSIDGFSATVDGESVDPEVTERQRHYEVGVPVDDVSNGDTVSVTMTYEVAGTGNDARVPLFVPEYTTSGETAVVDLRVVLPEGQQFTGDTFPRMDSVEGNVGSSELLHVPGFVRANYGASGGIGLNTVLGALGVLIVVGVLVGWALMQRRRVQRVGGEPDVR